MKNSCIVTSYIIIPDILELVRYVIISIGFISKKARYAIDAASSEQSSRERIIDRLFRLLQSILLYQCTVVILLKKTRPIHHLILILLFRPTRFIRSSVEGMN